MGPAIEPPALAGHSYDPNGLGLPKPPGFIRTFFRRNPWIVDTILMAAFFYPSVITQVAQYFLSPRPWPLITLSLVLSIAVSAAVLFRRFVPRLLAAVAVLSLLVGFPYAEMSGESVGVVLALYAVAVYHSVRAAWVWTLIAVLVALVGCVFLSEGDPWALLVSAFGYAMVFLVAVLIGVTAGNRTRYVEALLDRASQLARERDQQAQLAAASERARIAREMHDIVAHSLTVMVTLADGAAAAAAANPERAKAAMTQVGEIGRNSLGDMRRVLGVLGDASGDAADSPDAAAGAEAVHASRAPQPRFDDLRPLIDSYRAAGLPVSLTISGRAPSDRMVQLTVYRVAQESLTNALRYARHPTLVDVRVEFSPGSGSTVTVTDDGLGSLSGAPVASVGSGRGLIGMRERVEALHGAVAAGRLEPRGWQVRATIPTIPEASS